jgi:hypothetical protein
MGLFRRFKGMIYPGMGASYDDAHRICKTRSRWMVEYLRARRDPSLRYKAMARRNHLDTRAADQREGAGMPLPPPQPPAKNMDEDRASDPSGSVYGRS